MFYDRLEGPAQEAYTRAINIIYKEAQSQLGVQKEGLVIRQGLPDVDFGLDPGAGGWGIDPAGSGTQTLLQKQPIADDRFIAFVGLALGASPGTATGGSGYDKSDMILSSLQKVLISRGNRDVREWEIQQLGAQGSHNGQRWWVDDPVTTFQQTPVTVRVGVHDWEGSIAALGDGTAIVVPISRVVEQEGRTISK